ncbi:MAG: hypothetical protein JW854_12835 [Actinobacteria bacterium]|nr:hypothetical protein [Actinomycetota bacterium]
MSEQKGRNGMTGSDYKCALCEKKMRSGAEVYGLGVKLKQGFEYPGAVGRTMAVHLPVQGREVECMVTADGSQARLEGWDLIFMVCSEKCGAELKSLLEKEGLFEEIM